MALRGRGYRPRQRLIPAAAGKQPFALRIRKAGNDALKAAAASALPPPKPPRRLLKLLISRAAWNHDYGRNPKSQPLARDGEPWTDATDCWLAWKLDVSERTIRYWRAYWTARNVIRFRPRRARPRGGGRVASRYYLDLPALAAAGSRAPAASAAAQAASAAALDAEREALQRRQKPLGREMVGSAGAGGKAGKPRDDQPPPPDGAAAVASIEAQLAQALPDLPRAPPARRSAAL